MKIRLSVVLVVGVLAAGCGGGDDDGEPLVGGSLTAEFAGTAFTPTNGYATVRNGNGFIALGDGSIHCGSENSNDPPSGRNAILGPDMLEVGNYSNVGVQMIQNVDGFDSVGTNSGSVSITAVTDDTVTGTVDYDYTDEDDGSHYAISGSFEVVHCAP